MSAYVYDTAGTLLESWEDGTRTYTDYRPDPDETRPYTPEENAGADERAAEELAAAEHAATEERVRAIVDDLKVEKDKLDAIVETDSATINDSPAAYVKDTARSAKRIADACVDLSKYVGEL